MTALTHPVNYPARWETDVALADGGTVHVRPIRPDDAERLVRFHSRQSAQSIYFRFFSPRPRLSDRDVERFTNVDYEDRMAFVAILGEEIIGVARYDRYGPAGRAEVAFFVDDAHHGRGLATLLLEYLAVAGKENGITGFVATVLPENRNMIGVFRQAGFEVSTTFNDGVVEVELGIEPTADGEQKIADRARRAEARSVARLLRPASVAVIGASREPDTVGHEVFRNLLEGGFCGPVYPVNPAARSVRSVRAYATLEDIPDEVDVAVIAVPAPEVAAVVADCARKRVDGLIVMSDGFADPTSPEADSRQRELVALARRHGMRLIGPAGVGLLNNDPDVRLRATIAPATPAPGQVAMSAQSGSLGAAILEYAAELGVGLSSFVGLGDKADVSGNDLLQYWEDDERTSVVLLYLESFGNPRKFFRIARRLCRTKPVVAVRTAGFAAGADHDTWPSPATYSALLSQAGVIEASSLAELFDVARVLDRQPVPRGRRVAVVANALSPGLLAAEAAARFGLELAQLDGVNPVDLGVRAGEEEYRRALDALLADDRVDALIVLFAPPILHRSEEVAAAVEAAAAAADKPVVATFLGERPGDEPSLVGRVPRFRFPEEAARSLALVARYGAWRAQPPGTVPNLPDASPEAAASLVSAALAGLPPGGGRLSLGATLDLLAAVGIRPVAQREATSLEEAVDAAGAVGFPVALKAGGRGWLARTEETGLALSLHDVDALVAAYRRMCERLGDAMSRALVQAMAEPGIDAQIVVHQDARLGPIAALGRGGVAGSRPTELAVRLVPLTDVDASRLIDASPIGRMLAALNSPTSLAELCSLLHRLARLAETVPEVAEVRLDPVLVSPGGVAVTDVGARVAPFARPELPDVRRL